jgi:hypothetical protein
LLRKADGADVDFLREGVRTLAQALMEVEVTAQVGAERGERAPERRVTHRNGYRPRVGHPGRHGRAAGSQAARWQLLPIDPGATPTGRAGAGQRGDGLLRGGRVHPAG